MKPLSETQLSETDLHAYIDGALSSEKAEAMHAYLSLRPDEARRIGFYLRLNLRLRSEFGQVCPLPAVGTGTGARPITLALAGALLGRFAVVIAAIWLIAQIHTSAIKFATIDALVVEKSAPSAAAHFFAAPNLSAARFHFAGGRQIMVGRIPTLSVIIYRDTNGNPLVLLFAPASAPAFRTPWLVHRIGAVRVVAWTSAAGFHTVTAAFAGPPGLVQAADVLQATEDRF